MRCQIVPQFKVKLNQRIHGYAYAQAFKTRDPDVCECRTQGVFAVEVERFGNDGDDCEEDADEAVLEDAEVDDLWECLVCVRFVVKVMANIH